jgi:hypothetical protein
VGRAGSSRCVEAPGGPPPLPNDALGRTQGNPGAIVQMPSLCHVARFVLCCTFDNVERTHSLPCAWEVPAAC